MLDCLIATTVPRVDGHSTSGYNKNLVVKHFPSETDVALKAISG